MPTCMTMDPFYREHKNLFLSEKYIYTKYLYRFSKDTQIAWSPAINPLEIKDVPGVWWSEKGDVNLEENNG